MRSSVLNRRDRITGDGAIKVTDRWFVIAISFRLTAFMKFSRRSFIIKPWRRRGFLRRRFATCPQVKKLIRSNLRVIYLNPGRPVNFFSLSSDLIVLDRPLPYDLFINSSSLENRQRFVRIFKKGEPLSREELKAFISKYRQLYLAEEERESFLKSLITVEGVPDKVKTAVIKDSTIRRLKSLFETEHTGEALCETLSQSRDCVDSMIDVIHDYTVDQLQDMISNLGFHDSYTYDHSINVAMYSILIYKLIDPKASRETLTQAGMGGLFHDLGKVKLPTSILNNSGKLTDEEFAAIESIRKTATIC